MRVMRLLALALSAAGLVACGPRQVEVRSTPSSAAPGEAANVRMTNNLSQAVNVYVVTDGNEVFVRQVAPAATEVLAVRGVASGATVQLKATTVDGTRTYTKDGVVLSPNVVWQVP